MIKKLVSQPKTVLSLFFVILFFSLFFAQVIWADTTTTTFNQTINEGTLSVDIVDAAGDTVGSPAVTFGAVSFSFDAQNAIGTLGTASEKIRVSNPTTTAAWNLSIAATGGAGTTWTDGGTNTYPFDSTGGADTGRMTVDAATNGVITPWGTCTNTGLTLGTSDFFLNGTTDSIDLLTAGGTADTSCRWDLTAVDVTQRIPAGQVPTSYTLGMTITVI